MPTSDAATPVALSASLLYGAAAAAAALWIGTAGSRRVAPLGQALGEAHRRLRRERARRESAGVSALQRLLPAFVPVVRALPLDSLRRSLAERYAEAGWPGGFEDDEVTAGALLLGAALALPLGFLAAAVTPLAAPVGLLGFLLGPGLVSSRLGQTAQERAAAIQRTMPFVLDLLVLTTRAGASLESAIERAAIDFARHPIGVELRAVLVDLEMGVPVAEAFENLARRAPMPAVRSFVDEMVQARELGQPVADTLEALADRTRERRIQEAVETAGKAKVKILVPGMLILLATMLLLFAPFIVKFWYEGIDVG